MKDLIMVVPDNNIRHAMEGLLSRPRSINIREDVVYDFFIHVERDPGCLRTAHSYLRTFQRNFNKAIVIFDRHGCGRDDLSCADLQDAVQTNLDQSGWQERAAVVVIDPELESWIWSDSPQLEVVLGWTLESRVRPWLQENGFTFNGTKPTDPKEAFEHALRFVNRPRSSAIYKELAQKVSVARCADPAFGRLLQVLRTWFPANASAAVPNA